MEVAVLPTAHTTLAAAAADMPAGEECLTLGANPRVVAAAAEAVGVGCLAEQPPRCVGKKSGRSRKRRQGDNNGSSGGHAVEDLPHSMPHIS